MIKQKIEVRTDCKYNDAVLKTALQWNKEKMSVKDGEVGTEMYANFHRQNKYIYFSAEQVRPFTEDECEAEKKEKQRKYQAKKEAIRLEKELEKKFLQEQIELNLKKERASGYMCGFEMAGKPLAKILIDAAIEKESIPCNNPSKIIVFDTETTGLFDDSEILQLSIIDGDGNILLNTYVRPYYTYDWIEARAINGIEKEFVENSPYPHELIPIVKGIVESAELIVGYNVYFDIKKLKNWGINFDEKKTYDVMTNYAVLNGEWDEYRCDYKWKKLYECAAFFGYEFDAHDSLEDAKATLHCYRKIQEIPITENCPYV